ncbi:c-type cytochrome [Rhodohalobacter sp. 8-1]|uniref:c-type cytochrome n=1 Tax=Rhodohalobacter sp. 8-1 TaxID=3131972 RepID=UPI0030EE660C
MKSTGAFKAQYVHPEGSNDHIGAAKDSLAQAIEVRPGFEVQKIYEVPREQQGSWVALSIGPKGHLIASDQEKKGMFRVKISGDIDDPDVIAEELTMPISGAQGLQWVDENFYVNVNGRGLFRMKHDEEKGLFNILEYLGGPEGRGEHGNHAVIKAQDNNDLFVVNGNHTPPPAYTSSSIKNWKEDILLPRNWDARGHARGITAPGGYIARINSDATEWHMISIGYRNTYDIAQNQYEDLFAYDSDMEWDMGMPWYRPTRLLHAVSGSDFGWRSGSGKWKEYYEDSLPPVVNVGPGSPTGLLFGTGAKYPAKYQRALFGLDWTFGTMYAFHIKPEGASYTAEVEEFLSGSPLPLADAVIGSDGYMYFVTGGRDKESTLYRVVYKGNISADETEFFEDSDESEDPRELRKTLEAFHGIQDPEALGASWPHLNSHDRFIRHAARVAVEWQPVDTWAEKAMSEVRTQARITALVALARAGSEQYRDGATESLLELNFDALPTMQKLGYLRGASLLFMRLGDPTDQQRSEISDILVNHLPHEDVRVNTEAIRLLVYLEEPRVIGKALALLQDNKTPPAPDWDSTLIARSEQYGGTIMEMLNNPPPVHKLEYAFMLRNLAHGWTTEQRREYFAFINEASEQGMGGNSYIGFLERMRDEALRNASKEEIAAVSDLTGVSLNRTPDFEINPPVGPGREWTVEEALEVLNDDQNSDGNERTGEQNFERGRSLFHATLCASCHRAGGFGGNIGPDLSSVSNRFSRKEILEEIIHPSRVISDQYSSYLLKTDNGESYTGQIVKRRDTVEIYTQNMDQPPATVPRDQVVSIEKVETSQMPPGLINTLNPEELRVLFDYLIAGGNPESDLYNENDGGAGAENDED